MCVLAHHGESRKNEYKYCLPFPQKA
jgi:hypothetical protein